MGFLRRADPAVENRARVLDIARATLDSEFLRANRWDEKARGQATLAGTWFAVTQAVSAVAAGNHVPNGWVVALAFGLVLQAAALVMNLLRSASVWKPRDRLEFGRETLDALNDRMSEPPDQVVSDLLTFFRSALDGAQRANKERGNAFAVAFFWWWFVLGVGVVEIGAALIARLT